MSGNGGNPDPSFEERLRAAQRRQGADTTTPVVSGGSSDGLGFGLRAGMELVAAEIVAGAIGYGLDRLLRTLPLFLVIFILLGGAAGVANVWRVMSPARPDAKIDGRKRDG
jgi:ATP synthase protein I